MYTPKKAEDHKPPAAPQCRRGYLVDFDYAFVSESNKTLTRMKTKQFKTRKNPVVSVGHRMVNGIS